MFRLLSKESNIFSIPVYVLFLLLSFTFSNILDINDLNLISGIITFIGISLGYFLFNSIALNQYTHIPLFLYTFFVLAFYPGDLEIGLAVNLLINSFILLILTSKDDYIRKSSFVLVGSLLAINYLFFPFSWPISVFVLFHIIGTSSKIGLNIFRLIFGAILITLSYFGIAFILDYNSWDYYYFPFYLRGEFLKSYSEFYALIPIFLMLIFAIYDHFKHYNEKSPISRYKYTFVLVFTTAQAITVIFYMNYRYEYLLLLALPASIILSRMLKFLPKYWMQELSIWIIIFSLIAFKVSNINLSLI